MTAIYQAWLVACYMPWIRPEMVMRDLQPFADCLPNIPGC